MSPGLYRHGMYPDLDFCVLLQGIIYPNYNAEFKNKMSVCVFFHQYSWGIMGLQKTKGPVPGRKKHFMTEGSENRYRSKDAETPSALQ